MHVLERAYPQLEHMHERDADDFFGVLLAHAFRSIFRRAKRVKENELVFTGAVAAAAAPCSQRTGPPRQDRYQNQSQCRERCAHGADARRTAHLPERSSLANLVARRVRSMATRY